MIDRDAFIRERALMMARSDWTYGRLERTEIFEQARRYESYMRGTPVLATDSSDTVAMTEDSIIERVARAMAARDGYGWDNCSESMRQQYQSHSCTVGNLASHARCDQTVETTLPEMAMTLFFEAR